MTKAADGARSALTVGLGVIAALDGSEPHPDWGGWRGFIEKNCELREEADGVRFFGSANCNFIAFPTGELHQNYGYHGRALMNKVREEGWRTVLGGIKTAREEFKTLMRETMTPNVEVTGAARLYRAASVWTAGLGIG